MNETLKIKGEWTGYSLAPHITENDPAVFQLRDISRNKISEEDKKKFLNALIDKGIVLRVVQNTNIVPTNGRNIFARRLTGTGTPSGVINYMALGSGTTAFSNASTILNNEIFRKLVSSSAYDSNIAYLDLFVASGDIANQTFTEAGAFIDGTSGTATGSAFSLVIQNLTKSGSMFISLQITIT